MTEEQQQNIDTIEMDDSGKQIHTSNVDYLKWKTVIFSQSRKRGNSDIDSSSGRPTKVLTKNQTQPVSVIPTRNRYSVLSTPEIEIKENGKKSIIPPIFLKSEVKYLDLCKLLTEVVGGDQNFKCVSTLKGITIHPMSPESYRKIVHCLKQNNAEYHTYQLPEDKTFRVVIRGLHHTVDPEIISQELKAKGFAVRNVINVWSRDKTRLPLFFVDLEKSEDNDNIFDLNNLLHARIHVEEPRPKRQIVQCMRCQQFGHTRKYCNLPPKCVGCAGNHESSTCTKPKETPATCALCGGNHPANYRGCSVHRELQNRRAPKSKSLPMMQSTNQHRLITQPPEINDTTFPHLPESKYKNNTQSPNTHKSQNDRPVGLEHSYAKRLQEPNVTDQNEMNNLMNYITSLLTELKTMFTPMISLMTQLMQVLLNKHDK